MTIVYIRWKDAQNSNATHAIASLGDLAILDEVGFLLKETEETLTIGTESPQDALEARFWLTIPKNSIVEQRRTTLAKAFPKPRTKRKLHVRQGAPAGAAPQADQKTGSTDSINSTELVITGENQSSDNAVKSFVSDHPRHGN